MALQQFNVAALAEYDGERLKTAFERAIDAAIRDCQERGGLDKGRKVTLELEFVPVCPTTTHDDVETVTMTYRVKSTVPAQQRDSLSLAVRKGGMLVFNGESIGNVNQKTLDEQE